MWATLGKILLSLVSSKASQNGNTMIKDLSDTWGKTSKLTNSAKIKVGE